MMIRFHHDFLALIPSWQPMCFWIRTHQWRRTIWTTFVDPASAIHARIKRRNLSLSAVVTLVHSFIITHLDYCNSVVVGLPKFRFPQIQSLTTANKPKYSRKKQNIFKKRYAGFLMGYALHSWSSCWHVYWLSALHRDAPEREHCVPVSRSKLDQWSLSPVAYWCVGAKLPHFKSKTSNLFVHWICSPRTEYLCNVAFNSMQQKFANFLKTRLLRSVR